VAVGGRSEAFTVYRVALKGETRVDSLIQLLVNFYDRDYLHRVQNLKITQFPNEPERVSVSMIAEVLALKTADLKQAPSLASSGRLSKTASEYQDAILNRNPFAPPNRAPVFSTAANQDVPREKDWSIELKANDPDARHRIKYRLLSEKPEGMQFNEETGKLSWTPKSNGNYELLVEAIDSGFPPKKSEQKLVFKVIDPPAAPVEGPQFDAASQSFVSAIVSGRSGSQVWIRTKTDNHTYKLSTGDEVSIGSVKGKIVDVNVDAQFVEMETNGHRWTFGMYVGYLQDAFKKAEIE
jgi:hypothetical protein